MTDPNFGACTPLRALRRGVVSLLTLLSIVVALSAQLALAQTAGAAKHSADEAAIRRGAAAFAAAFKREDADAIAQMWTTDCEYVDEAGRRYEGRSAIQQEYEKFFKDHDSEEMRITIESIRFIAPNVAVEDGTAELVPAPAGVASPSRYVAVDVKQPDGRWRLASVHDSAADATAPVAPTELLESLVGDWSAENAGTKADVSCHWNAPQSFLERRFMVTRDGKTVSSATEIIGWDPATRQVRSWTFASDGGRAEGAWTPLADGWMVRNAGVTAAGVPTASVDVWAPLLDGALGWRSTRRAVDGNRLASPDYVVLKKKSPAEGAKN